MAQVSGTSGGSAVTSLAGHVVLVTGAGSGIGRATATLAAEAGAYVVALDLEGHDETAAAVGKAGGDGEAQRLDVTDAEAWEAVVESVMDRHHRLDALANVAGIVSDRDSLLDQDEEGWERLVAVDLKGPWLGMKAVVPRMLEAGGGKVVNVASTAGLIGMPNTLAYSAAKGGVIAMSRQVAVEYAARGIRVNTVAPGVTQTAMLGDITEDLLTMVTAATPAGRLGTPEDPARMIVYLLGAGGDFVTGQVIPIDGGWTAQ
jgi:NAD(P)-dependent dehydrogenase (short-subunit alcohol dehydrogenase family)